MSSNVEQFPSAGPKTTEQVVETVLNNLRGVDLATACEATTVVLGELARALNRGNVDAAAIDVIGNLIAFYKKFPETSIAGLTVVPHTHGNVQ